MKKINDLLLILKSRGFPVDQSVLNPETTGRRIEMEQEHSFNDSHCCTRCGMHESKWLITHQSCHRTHTELYADLRNVEARYAELRTLVEAWQRLGLVCHSNDLTDEEWLSEVKKATNATNALMDWKHR